MNTRFFLLTFLFIIPAFVSAQNQATGLLPEDATYDKLTLVKRKDDSKYPIKAQASLKFYCPIPGNQGGISSCVGWATGYHAITISKAIQDSITDKEAIEKLTHSAAYIFNQINKEGDCSQGIYLTDALSFLKKYGTPSAFTFNNSSSNCNYYPDSTAIEEALKSRIKNFYPIFKTSTLDSIKVEETKLWISRKKPVIIGLNLTEDFYNIAYEQKVWEPNVAAKTNNYHAMVVVSYENKGTSGEFELLNSFGHYWGDEGYIKMKYEDFGQLVKYAFILDSIGDFSNNLLSDFTGTTEMPALGTGSAKASFSSSTDLQRLHFRADDSYFFTQEAVAYDSTNQYYQSVKQPWSKESQFQLHVKDLYSGRHLYAFSFNALKKVDAVWPSKNPLEKWKGLQQMEVILPWDTDVLELSYSGREYLVLLYSNQALSNFDAYLRRFENARGTFDARMQQVFGDLLVDRNLINYQADAIHFDYISAENNGELIPVILAFDVE